MFIDSHCHLDRLDLSAYDGDLTGALKAAHDRGVKEMLCIGIDLNNAQTVVDIAHRYEGVYASVGVHPMDVGAALVDCDQLAVLAASPKVVAIGETGLDYHYSRESAELQRQNFELHLDLARNVNKPVVVHTRAAQQDTLQLLEAYAASDNAGGVLHCFTENWEMARRALDLGFYISFSGIITFRNAGDLRDVVRKVPLERMLIETDSPYLAPVPFRGKKNEPQYVVEVATCAADLRGISVQQLAETTSKNFHNLFF